LETENYLQLSVGDFLDRLATTRAAPGGGSAAALTVAFAAGLVALVARASRTVWDDAPGVAAQAVALQDRAAPLAEADAVAWTEAVRALKGSERDGEGNGRRRNHELEQKLDRAAAVPLAIAELAADTAQLAAVAAENGKDALRADAVAAAALAAGAARAATHLVEVNLGVLSDDERLARARASDQAASEAADRVLASIP
jgi:methenyltetrahydrofolate cyclohydrolase